MAIAEQFAGLDMEQLGLIKCGPVVIPVDNQISKDTDLYKLYNTNIHELIEERKKRESGK